MTLLPAGTMVAYQVDGEDRERIAAAINQLSLAWEQEVREPDGADTVLVTGTDGEEYARMSQASNPYGDGLASRRIAGAIAAWFAEKQQSAEGGL